MAERLPDRRLVVYPGLGHSIDAIHPEGCTQQVREFVASLTIQGGNYAVKVCRAGSNPPGAGVSSGVVLLSGGGHAAF